MILRQLVADCPPLDQEKIDDLISRFLENSDKGIEYLLTPQRFIYVCHKAYMELRECGSLVHVHCPNGIYVVGDLNGSFKDLIMLLDTIKLPITKTIVFLGNYIDETPRALHTLMLLLLLKIRFPRKIILLRGKHEIWEINKNLGLQKELCKIYHGQGHIMYYNLNEIFDSMPLVAILSDQIYCCHGGISQFAQYRSDIANIPKKSAWPSNADAYRLRAIFTDTIWAEPHFRQTLSYTPSDRYYSYYFNRNALIKKLQQFKCRVLICGVSSNPDNMSLRKNNSEVGDGCEELFEGLCYALYSSHINRKHSFNASMILFKFNSTNSMLDAEVFCHTLEETKIVEALENIRNEFINKKKDYPLKIDTKFTCCQSCADWRQGIDTKSLQSNRCLSHPEMLRIMMKFGGPVMAEKYASGIIKMKFQELVNFASAHTFTFFLHDLLNNSKKEGRATLYREVELPPYSFTWVLPSDLSSWPKLELRGKFSKSNSAYQNFILSQ